MNSVSAPKPTTPADMELPADASGILTIDLDAIVANWRKLEKHGVPAGIFRPLLQSALAFAGYNLVFGAVQPNIDNAAHVGGFAGGAILGWTCALPPLREARDRLWLGRGIAGLAVACTVIVAGAVFAAQRLHR